MCNAQRRRPLWRLDRIRSRGGDARRTTPTTFIWMFPLCDLQWYVDLISLTRCFASRISDLGSLLFVFIGNFFVFYAAKPFSGIRARSMRGCFTWVKHNIIVAGIDVFGASFFSCTSWCRGILGLKRPRPTLHDRVHETGSAVAWSTYAAGGCLYLPL
jgi:hypothetical protein